MFLDEARLSATLTHPHVIEVYDVGADGDAPFFAMEYVHGANLREMLRTQARAAGKPTAPLPLAHAIAIVAAAAEACTTRTNGWARAASRWGSCTATSRRRTCWSRTTAP